MAAVGHFFWHSVHMLHFEISIEMLPLVFLNVGRFSKGYRRVAGRDSTLRVTTFAIFICDMITAPYS